MAPPQLPEEELQRLQSFISICKGAPEILHTPQLKFFKDYLDSLHANIPPPPSKAEEPPQEEKPQSTKEPEEAQPSSEEEEIVESDLELDPLDGVVEPDSGEEAPFGDETIEVTEEMMDESNMKRAEATEALNEGKLEDAVKLFTEAILKNPQSGALYAKRAGAFLKMKKCNAAITDCDKALLLNPDQALAFKYRGRAYRLLGDWEKAASNLAMACKLDYTDEANEWLKEVTPNAKKIQEHRRKYERKHYERELRRRAKEGKQDKQSGGDTGGFGFPGGMPFMPGGIEKILQDPEVLAAFQDPEVAAAFQDISTNPSNIPKYQSNPKISKVIEMMTRKVAGASSEFK